MKPNILQMRSLHLFQRLLAPIVALYIHRRRYKSAVAREKPLHRLPSVDDLRAEPFFSKWPDTTLQGLIASGTFVVHAAATSIGFAREPPSSARVFWVLSGTIAEVPTKSELCECASGLLYMKPGAPKTGPEVLPFYFAGGERREHPPTATQTQQRIMDCLACFHAGQLVDAERLLLGGGRRRTLRCQTDATLLSFPFSLLLRDVQGLPNSARSYTIDLARSAAERSMAQLGEMPSVLSITGANPVLLGLPSSSLRSLHLQLKPVVFTPFEVVCQDVTRSEHIYFLHTGRVLTEEYDGSSPSIVSKRSTAVGLETFVQYRLPEYYDQKKRAKAATFCEMWGMPLSAFASLCDAASRLRFAQTATHILRNEKNRLVLATALRSCHCFRDLSEAAITVVGQALSFRVYCAGDLIVPALRAPGSGIVLVAGTAVARCSKTRTSHTLQLGQPHYFCESFVRVELSEAVTSVSSTIILHGSPETIFERMEESAVIADEMTSVVERAQEYVNARYGAGVSALSKAQNAAAARVRAYKRQHIDAVQKLPAANSTTSTHETIASMENELLISLSLQIQSLHRSAEEEAHYAVFREGPSHELDHNAVVEPPRSTECFSLDEEGNIITCAPAALPLPRRLTAPSIAQPVTPPPAPSTEAPGPSRLHPEKAKKGSLSTQSTAPPQQRSLRTAVRTAAPAAKEQRPTLSPRLSALWNTAKQLKDEADGIDRRKDFVRKLTRPKHLQ